MLTLETGGDYKLRLPAGTKRAWRLPLSRASSFNLHLRQQAVITMSTAIPSIACLGVIGRNNNPLHISIFPSLDPVTNTFAPIRTPLQFSLLLSSTIDVFDLRAKNNAVSGVGLSGDFGLLHAVDDRLAAYGFETNTGVRMVCLVDMRGRRVDGNAPVAASRGAAAGLRDAELKPVFRAMQHAYVKLLQNPFYDPDEHAPLGGRGGKKITSRKFADDMKRIGEGWTPGVTNL
ncbi:hypothetical protein FOIG_07046 [Fusarium odoratissimum NRRL 54006]|uniref:Trafficking protein particle complex subunit 2-like protein n=1 Tax=Fusarium odoratissimum (strain NRRL 54006) TaxID=1089451 RepID=X0JJI6_FUSO5|nr:uncharacterized protein FOIG_07046 [Fusarium odoratissimum NRRL 54006]EXM01434.1 hypothetical protein FOIG_07046 [Fusarium odoratissimum NRRL 54006]